MLTDYHSSDVEFNEYINTALKELYDILIQKYGAQFFVNPTPATIPVLANVDTYALPKDCYKVAGVEVSLNLINNTWVTIRPFNFNERNRYNWAPMAWNIFGVANVRYNILGSYIKFTPGPIIPTTYVRIWYSPVFVELVNDTDTLDNPTYCPLISTNGWDNYAVIKAAILAKIKEEGDITELMAELNAQMQRIEDTAGTRDEAEPSVTVDVNAINFFPFPGYT
jgi:hypothetical protein